MAKYISNRQQNLKIGIVSYTENQTVLEVTGNVGIGTTNTQGYELYVNGDTNIAGDVNVGGASTFVGVGTFSGDLYVGGDLYVSDDIVFDELTARNINITGISTFRNNVELFGPSNAELFWNSSETTLKFNDNVSAHFGNGDDLKIFHNGSDSFISDTGTGYLRLISDGLGVVIQKSGTESIANFNTDGSVELYYDNSKKFETTGAGISISNGNSDIATIYAPSTLIIDPMPVGVGTTSGVVRIKGDLYVDGTEFIVNSTTI